MKIEQPIKKILTATRHLWDKAMTRPVVRENFLKLLNCRTDALGAAIYASEHEEKIVYYTCKSRICPSCGQRLTDIWQRELLASLPDVPYRGVVFTMPKELWPIFQENRHLLDDLPVLGAKALEQWFRTKHGVSVYVFVVPHTFSRNLGFNSHLHVLVSDGGLRVSDSTWIPALGVNENAVMRIWKQGVIALLLEAMKSEVLKYNVDPDELREELIALGDRWWNVKINRVESKKHFLEYACRYVRRPPIAQRRFLEITDQEVSFITNDLKTKKVVPTNYSLTGFVAAFAEHVPDRYRHAVRYFGLLAPASKGRTAAGIFAILGQPVRPKPKRLSWAMSRLQSFGIDPLIDSKGQRMQLIKRLAPVTK